MTTRAPVLSIILPVVLLVGCGASDDDVERPSADAPLLPDDGSDGAPDQPPEPEDNGDMGFDDTDRDEREAAAQSLLGAPEAEVDESAEVRIVRRGDEESPVTMDLRPGRLSVELDEVDGTFRVTRVVVEVPDGQDPLVVE